MKNNIFHLPAKIQDAPQSIPLFHTAYNPDYFRKRSYIHQKTDKIYSISRMLNVSGDLIEQGSRLSIITERQALEVYNTSDSLWFTERNLANNENIEWSKTLPDEKSAAKMAIQQIDALGLSNAALRPTGISYTQLSISRSPKDKPKEYKTELHNNFVFELERLPVFGPGAKAKVSFVNGQQLSDLYYFWREPRLAGEVRIISPERALDILSRNSRFALLSEDCSVRYSTVQLGYYAASPDKLQSVLFPVYCVKGIVSTQALPKYEFTLYVQAQVAGKSEQLKTSRLLLFPLPNRVF